MDAHEVPGTCRTYDTDDLVEDMAASSLSSTRVPDGAEDDAQPEQSITALQNKYSLKIEYRQNVKEREANMEETGEENKSSNTPGEEDNSASPSNNNFLTTSSSPTHIPVLPHYTTRSVPSSRSKASEYKYTGDSDHLEQADFATHPIKAGTRLIHEPPLITLPAPGDQTVELMEAFYALSKPDQDRIWTLNPSDIVASQQLSDIADIIDPVVIFVRDLILKPQQHWTPTERNLFHDVAPRIEPCITLWRIAARWHAGRYSLLDTREAQRDDLPADTPFAALFLETARLRHSCVPNCLAAYNPASNHITVHVTRPITPSEELTLSSIPDIYYTTAVQRSRVLAENFGITCSCEACDESHAAFKLHESTRLAAHATVVQLSRSLANIETIDDNHISAALCPPADLYANLLSAQTQILHLLKLLRKTGCAGVEQICWRKALVERVQPRIARGLGEDDVVKMWRVILGHAKACEVLAGRCWGGDHGEVERLVERRGRLRGGLRR